MGEERRTSSGCRNWERNFGHAFRERRVFLCQLATNRVDTTTFTQVATNVDANIRTQARKWASAKASSGSRECV